MRRKFVNSFCSTWIVIHLQMNRAWAEDPSLLVSTAAGIYQVSTTDGTSLSEPSLLPLNVTNPSHVQRDNRQGRIYWAEKSLQVTRILQADLKNLDTSPKMVFQQEHLNIRYPIEELQDFAVDWLTSNIYIVFRGQRRILACSNLNNETATGNKCVELYGNQVASSVGGLALEIDDGNIYWTEQDDDHLAIVQGDTDGSFRRTLQGQGLKNPTSITVNAYQAYWVDSFRQRIEHLNTKRDEPRKVLKHAKYVDFAPQRVAIYNERLYWVGKARDGSSEAIFSLDENVILYGSSDNGKVERFIVGNLTQVNGLAVYDRNWQKSYIRENSCAKGRPCAGVCLLSHTFTCICPIGLVPDNSSRSSCQEPEMPIVIYGVTHGTLPNGSAVSGISNAQLGVVTYDPVSGELFWLGGSICWRQMGASQDLCLTNLRSIDRVNHTEMTGNESKFAETNGLAKGTVFEGAEALTLEYDWIGENFYVVCRHFYEHDTRDAHCVCSKTGECTPVHYVINGRISKVALDPPNGHVYWIQTDERIFAKAPEIWRVGMDGTGPTVIHPSSTGVLDLTVDHCSQLLFWVEPWEEEEIFWEIFRSDLDGNNVKRVISLRRRPVRIRVAGNRLFWLSSGNQSVTSCEKETANNLATHELRDFNANVADFLVMTPKNYSSGAPGMEKDPCIPGALCSHMCVPTPAGYMRCLCPLGYKLGPDGWNCECVDSALCSNNTNLPERLMAAQTINSTTLNQWSCQGSVFHCGGTCIDTDSICNGFLDCADLSDEGDRCNEICSDNHGCSHTCHPSPKGPICFCPPNQTLAEDMKTCIFTERITEVTPGSWRVGVIIAGVLGLFFTVIFIFGGYKYRQTRRKLRNLTEEEVKEFLRGDPVGARTAPDGHDRALLLPYTHVLSPNDIIRATETVLGSGEFGIVHPGIFQSEPVAIKTFKRSVEIDEFKAVLAELKIMAYMGDHEFIVKFIGAEISEIAKRKLMVVTELSPHGDLLHYLWKVGSVGSQTKDGEYENVAGSKVTTLTLHNWCEQIATGMEYLVQKQIVHGDLAARNVLVFKDNYVKIADFGLSKQLYGSSQYQKKIQCKLPWKWAAIELLTSMQFSQDSDVWAFGITAWEIFSLGQTPYKGTKFSWEFIRFLQAGNRLPKPEHASEEIYKVLLECWDSERSKRPNFTRLKQIFQEISTAEVGMREIYRSPRGDENITTSVYVSAV